MDAIDDVVAIVVGFVLTTLVGGWWAAVLQQRSWIRQNDVRMREAENQRAGTACQDLMTLLDKRLFRMHRLLGATTARARGAASEDVLEERLREYDEVVIAWNERLNMNLSLVGSHFGDVARAYLEGLYEEFRRVGLRVESAVRVARDGGDPASIAADAEGEFEGRDPGSLNDRVYQFGLMLMGQLREGTVGRYAPNKSTPRTADKLSAPQVDPGP